MGNEKKIDEESTAFGRLAALVEALRGEDGCPWDKKQTSRSMMVKLLEETYELADAVAKGKASGICEELGDVLFHIFFIARLFEEQGRFKIEDVAEGITRKMVRRHPHVFGDASAESAEDVKQQWHEIKRNEKAEAPSVSVLDSVPRMQPALMRAYRISVRAAREGFDWADLPGVFSKVDEELLELREAVADSSRDNTGDNREVLLEFGDLLFTMVNVARFLGVNPEAALMESTEKFENRFRHMEQAIKSSRRNLADMGQEEKDEFWDRAKTAESSSSG